MGSCQGGLGVCGRGLSGLRDTLLLCLALRYVLQGMCWPLLPHLETCLHGCESNSELKAGMAARVCAAWVSLQGVHTTEP